MPRTVPAFGGTEPTSNWEPQRAGNTARSVPHDKAGAVRDARKQEADETVSPHNRNWSRRVARRAFEEQATPYTGFVHTKASVRLTAANDEADGGHAVYVAGCCGDGDIGGFGAADLGSRRPALSAQICVGNEIEDRVTAARSAKTW